MDTGHVGLEPSPAVLSAVPSSDILASLEDHADVVSWINSTLEDGASSDGALGLIELDRRVSSIIGALEISSEDTSAEVERLIDDISRGASRLAYDLHFMRDGALSLQSVLHEVESKSKTTVAPETDVALDRLHHLDTVKRNMEAAREVLREAESWGTLESDVTSLLGEKNYEKAAERLSEANKSMAVFANTPEYENRRTLMVSLQNQLEAALSSALVSAVTSQDVAVCRNYFGIFSNIQRETEFRNYYYGSHRAPLIEAWQSAHLRDCDGGARADSSAQTFSSFLTTFYALFLAILQHERTSIPAIFPDPQSTLSTLITSTLAALHPTFSERLDAVVAYHGPRALRELIAAYRATEEFALSVEKTFERFGYAAGLSNAASDESSASSRRLRRRSSARMSMSMSRRMSSQPVVPSGPSTPSIAVFDTPALPIPEWDTELFEPFADFQADYAALEWRLLEDVLSGAMATGGADRAVVLKERAVDVFSAAEDAIGRCSAFTHGYGSASLVNVVDRLITAFADASRDEMTSRKKISGLGAGGGKASVSEEELADLDYTAEDWAEIQALLHLLEAVRALLDRTITFEGKLRAAIAQVSEALRAARQEMGMQIGGTTRGAIQLLMQSTLNSAALHALLERVDPEPVVQLQAASSIPSSPDARRSSFTSPTPPTALFATPSPVLLTSARSSISSLARACQVALQDTILEPLNAHLASYASLALWAAADPAKRPAPPSAGGAISAVRVPTFSLSPSAIMARVAEGLLSLPRLFEVYADDDALAVSLATLPHVSDRFLRALAEPPSAPQPPARTPPELRSRRSASLALTAAQLQAQGNAQSINDLPLEELHFSPEAVTAAWLASLTRTLLAHLTRDMLPRIPKLSGAGAAQLAADLGWLVNIVEALSVEWQPLNRWRRWVEEDDSEGKKKYRDSPDTEQEQHSESHAMEEEQEDDREENIVQTIARLRGWS